MTRSPFFLLYVLPIIRFAGGVLAYFGVMVAMTLLAAMIEWFFEWFFG